MVSVERRSSEPASGGVVNGSNAKPMAPTSAESSEPQAGGQVERAPSGGQDHGQDHQDEKGGHDHEDEKGIAVV